MSVQLSGNLIVKFDSKKTVSIDGVCNFTPYRTLNSEVLGEMTFDKYRGLETPINGSVNFERVLQKWFPDIVGFIEFKESGYFSSMDSSVTSSNEVAAGEYSARMAVKVYVTCPELGVEYEIPQKDILEVNLAWGVNEPIQWSVKLRNTERAYTAPTGTFAYLMRPGIWCNQRKTRKYIKIKFKSWCGDKTMFMTFPKLVIHGNPGDFEITISGRDEISEYLIRETDLDSYVAEEALSRVDEGSLSTWEKATAYSTGDKVFAPFNYITALKDVHDIWPDGVGYFIPIGTKYIPKSLISKNKYFELVALTYAKQGEISYTISR